MPYDGGQLRRRPPRQDPSGGIGPEAVPPGLAVMHAVTDSSVKLEFGEFPWDRECHPEHGRTMPEDAKETPPGSDG